MTLGQSHMRREDIYQLEEVYIDKFKIIVVNTEGDTITSGVDLSELTILLGYILHENLKF